MDNTHLWTKQFIFIMFINAMLFIGMQMQMSTLPIYISELGGNDSAVGLGSAVYTAAAVFSRAIAGFALDRFGRRGILFLGLIIMPLIMVTYSWFPIVAVVLTIRFLHGLGWGISTTASTTIASDIIPRKRYAEGFGYFTLSQSIALAVSPVIGFSLMNAFSYRAMTYFATGMLAITIIFALLLKFEKKDEKKTKQKFAPYEITAIRPAIVMVFIGSAVGSVFVFIPLYGQSLGFDNIALFFTAFAVAVFVVRLFTGRLVDRFGFNIVIIPSFVVLAVSLVLISYVNSLALFLASALFFGAAYGTVQTGLQTMSVINAQAHRRGAANATFFTGFDVGIGIGGVIAGIIATVVGYAMMYLTMTIFVIIGSILYLILAKSIRKLPDELIAESAIDSACKM
jgi:MFS family permease